MKSKVEISKELLEQLYFKENMSIRKIAKKLETTVKVIDRFFKNYGLEKDPQRQFVGKDGIYKVILKNYSQEAVYDLYIKQNKSNEDLQTLWGCKEGTVSKVLAHYNIHKDKARANEIAFQKKFEKWGSEASYNEYMVAKAIAVRKANGTQTTSETELNIYNLLSAYFGHDDVIRFFRDIRYSNKTGYKFQCDFYIKSLDIFIEYQGNWTHGFKPFTKSIDCLKQLEEWKKRAVKSKYYAEAIDVWTRRDVEKLAAVKANHLKFISIYSSQTGPFGDIYYYNIDEQMQTTLEKILKY